MQQRKVGPFKTSAIGLGCMNLSYAYGPAPTREEAERVLKGSIDAGYTFFDTAAVYGLGHNERLVGEVLKPHLNNITLASKCGMTNGEERDLNGSPERLKKTCDESLKRLGVEIIDLYYLHRWDKRVPIEESVGALSDLVKAGKIKTIGLSEVGEKTLRKAHATHPIAALQTEYSPWTRNPEIAVLKACRELGITFVAFSPVARGFLTGKASDPAKYDANDMRRTMPRFMGEALKANLKLLQAFAAIANEAGCTPAQLCLAWLLHKDENIVPIPGTQNAAHMAENAKAASVSLSAEIMDKIDATVNARTVQGGRYNDVLQATVDTED